MLKNGKASQEGAHSGLDAEEIMQELRLWQTNPDACKLIKTQSEVYHAAEDGAKEGTACIYPIIAAFDQRQGAASPSKEKIGERMRLVELLAVVGKAPEPGDAEIVRMVDTRLGLCRPMEAACTEAELNRLSLLLQQMHDIGEYLQLEKRLCKRVKQLGEAEILRSSGFSVPLVQDNKELGPLLKATIDALAATEVPSFFELKFLDFKEEFERQALRLSPILWDQTALLGALGKTSAEMTLPFNSKPNAVTTAQLRFLFGQAIAGREFSADLLSAVTNADENDVVKMTVNAVTEALVVLGRGKEALQLVDRCYLKMPRLLARACDRLDIGNREDEG